MLAPAYPSVSHRLPMSQPNAGNYVGMKGCLTLWTQIGILMDVGVDGWWGWGVSAVTGETELSWLKEKGLGG